MGILLSTGVGQHQINAEEIPSIAGNSEYGKIHLGDDSSFIHFIFENIGQIFGQLFAKREIKEMYFIRD